ncbi:Heterokaryon incompatibility protein 6, OR allele [Colletotrichum siamense]|uniref:Heterokaryon incompatibility protein 6, OR allele n=1 Tax=Colletotrichum siamense TaxID=690259 RepID=A0A9P5K8Y0_COLSI|nr:Heterokaryon incompatibility protein 6, OR allele [Colletotrichum siamense]KAF4864043.1 Heterokaryon incompatibility protein 6, OR allele [Colletotrichum siamense]
MTGYAHSQTAGKFPYRPLSPLEKEIRLIEVDPLHKIDTHSPVRCRLKHASLYTNPNYIALSYAWGDPTATRAIILDGRNVEVTENLESALRHVASSFGNEEEPGPTLWVDAICIDQQNESERTQQVAQMGAIFSTATRTMIWLGPADEHSDLAIETLHTLGRRGVRLHDHVPSWTNFPFSDTPSTRRVIRTQKMLDGILTSLSRGGSTKLAAISSLFGRPWFRRVWVIQERVLSSDTFVCCGDADIVWGRFFWGFWLLCGLRDYLNIVGTGVGRQDSSALALFLTTALDRVTPVAFTRSNSSFFTLFSLLSRMATTPQQQLQASDPRDYVFALLGLIDPEKSPSIVADYSKDWNTVQVEVATACLSFYGPRLLSFAGTCQENETAAANVQRAPSWAPDWSSQYIPQPLSITSDFVVRGGNLRSAYSASADCSQSLSGCFISDKQISLDAVHVDDVGQVGLPFVEADNLADDSARVASLASWIEGLEVLLGETNEVYTTPADVQEALWRTPIADRAYAYNWETERAGEKTFRAYQALRSGMICQGVKYANIASVKLRRRRPFGCIKGHIGLGPLELRDGDSVWVILGADVPFILRPAIDGGFLVVGEAYVHGIMDGEYVNSRTHPLQRIELA